MSRTRPPAVMPVGHLCPAIDAVARMVRRHVPAQDRAATLALLEEIREGATQLRANAGAWEEAARGGGVVAEPTWHDPEPGEEGAA